MKRKLLLLAALTAGIMQTNAQDINISKRPGTSSFGNAQAVNKAPQLKAEDGDIIRWGYPQAAIWSGGLNYEPETISQGITVPAKLLKGAKLKGVSIVLPYVPNLKDINVWVSSQLPADYVTGDIINVSPDPETLASKEFTDVMFDTPYTIGDEDFYVGYNFTQVEMTDEDDYWPLWRYDGAQEISGGYWLYTSTTFPSWFNISGYGYGNAAIDLLLDISECTAQGSVKVSEIGVTTAKTGDEVKFDLTLFNAGGFVKDIDFTYTQDGKDLSAHLPLGQPMTRLAQTSPLSLSTLVPTEPAAYDVSLSIDKVNGQDNAEDVTNETEGKLIAISQPADRRSVYEAFTTMSDAREVLAMGAYPLLKQAVGDKMIAINAHFSTSEENPDVLACADYDDAGFTLTNGTLPLYIIDRRQPMNPYYGLTPMDENKTYHFNADKVFNTVNERLCEADFGLTAKWADDAKTQIEATTATTFYFDSDEPFYAIGFVLTEDNVSYDGTVQVNALSPDYFDDWNYYYPENNKLFPDDDLAEYTTGSDSIDNPVNHNVVRGAWNALNGIDESIVAMKNGTEQSYSTTLDINGKEVLDKNNLKLVALLINLYDSSIANAAEVKLGDETVGVRGVVTEGLSVIEEARFAANGQQISTPQKGLNIVKLSNGKTMKVIVR